MSEPPIDLDRLRRECRIEPGLAYRHFLITGATPRLPGAVSIETSAACQLDCPMCDRAGMRREHLLMPDEVYRAVVAAIAPHRLKINFNGIGEPLLDKKLPDRVAHARAQGIPEAGLVSNGLLLEPRLARELIRAGLTRITLSLDGADPASHASGHAGADLALLEENLEALLSLRREQGPSPIEVVLRVTLQQGNLATLPALYRRWHGRGARIRLNFAYQYGDAATRPLLPYRWNERIPCPQMLSTMLVLTNGDATICCLGDVNAELGLGNLTRSSLEACYQGPRAREIRELHRAGNLADLPVCRRCSASTRSNFESGQLALALEAECLTRLEQTDQEGVESKAPVSR